MAKFSRRFFAPNPSSSIESSYLRSENLITEQKSTNQLDYQHHLKRSTTAAKPEIGVEHLPTIKQSEKQYTTETISNVRQNNNAYIPTIQHSNSSNNGNNKNFSNKINSNKSKIIPLQIPLSTYPELFNKTNVGNRGGFLSQNNENNFNNMTEAEFNAAERERIRMEFFATYDVMTGVRIAATLGGFFGLMVFLIVWKSRGQSNETLKVLKDPKTAALAVACMQEEEDRKIIEAMDATGLSIFPDEYDTMLFRRQRMMSLGNVSAPPILHRGFRFASVGGYSSLLEAPRRLSSSSYCGPAGSRRKSMSESLRILSRMGSSFGTDDYFMETDDELNEKTTIGQEEIAHNREFLEIPITGQDTRRSSAMTCCSTESSYLERRCSALTIGINNLPPSLRQKYLNSAEDKGRRGSSTDLWDYQYPDIQVIQPTPKTSPCPSEGDEKFKTSINIEPPPLPKINSISSTQPQSGFLQQQSTLDSSASSIPFDSNSSCYFPTNSISCYYDPESLEDHRLSLTSNSMNKKNSFKKGNNGLIGSNINNNRYSGNNTIDATSENKSLEQRVLEAVLRSSSIVGTGIGRAPLASCSSFKMSSIDYQDSEHQQSSFNDDSVFIESYADTDDDLEQFSTDSDEITLDDDDDIDDNINLKSQTLSKQSVPTLPITEKKSTNVIYRKCAETNSKGGVIPGGGVKNKIKSNISTNEDMNSTNNLRKYDYIELTESRYPTSYLQQQHPQPYQEELLLRPILSPANTPLLAIKRRALFHQQSSDPQSLPTTTEEATATTTTATLETTCSTEIPIAEHYSNKKKLLLRKQSSSFSYDNNDSSLSNSSSSNSNKQNKRISSRSFHGDYSKINYNKIKTITKDIVAFNVIDNNRSYSTTSKLYKNNITSSGKNKQAEQDFLKNYPSVILELPVINLPQESSVITSSLGGVSDLCHQGDKSQGSSCSEPILDPSLAGTSSRKWSKETLF